MKSEAYVIWIVTFTTMLGIGLIAPILSFYAKTLGANNFQVAFIFSIFMIARTITQIPAGHLSDIYGKKLFLTLGTFFYGLTTFFYNFVSNIFELLIVRFFTGVFSAFVTPIAGSYISAIAPKEKMGQYMGFFNSSISMGFGVGPIIGGFLAEHFSIKAPFYFCGFLGILASILSYFKLRDIKFKNKSRGINLKFYLKNKKFLIPFIFNTVILMGNSSVIVFLTIYAYRFGIGLDGSGFLIAFTNIISALLQKKLGSLYDKYGLNIIIVGLLLVSLGFFYLSLADNFYKIMLSLILQAIGSSLISTSLMSYVANLIPIERRGEGLGLFTTSLNFGFMFGSLFFGAIANVIGIGEMYKVVSLFSLIMGFSLFKILKS
ncbi:MFS transporter [Methanocaldococcus infernus]